MLRQVTKMAPFAQVLVYTVMPSGEAVADSMDFPVQLCLSNKVTADLHTPGLLFLNYFFYYIIESKDWALITKGEYTYRLTYTVATA